MVVFSAISKIYTHGIRHVFFRALIRITPINLKYPYYLFRKYFFGYAVITINGVRMHLDLDHDSGLSRELILHGKREGVTMDYFLNSSILKEGDIALDIGGNIGYYALPESRMVGETGRVYAVEPVLSNFELLRKNVALNGFQNIEVHQMAMGDKIEVMPIYVRAKKNLSSMARLPSDKDGDVIGIDEVKVTTVDMFAETIIRRTPTFVRMDVEGYEASILEGMRQTLNVGTTMLIEFHPMFLSETQKHRIVELFKEFNYSKFVITVNPKLAYNVIHTYLHRQIGMSVVRDGGIKDGDLALFREYLFTSKRVFNAFISR